MNLQSDFKEFITHTNGQKEISLAVLKDQVELDKIKLILSQEKFKLLESIKNFNETLTKAYVVLDESFSKMTYDFIKQYSTGSVEIFDTEKMEAKVVNPDYEKTSLIFLITEDKLKQITEQGFNLMSVVGICYRNN